MTRGSRIRRIFAVGDQPRAVWLSAGLLTLAALCGTVLDGTVLDGTVLGGTVLGGTVPGIEAAMPPLIAAAMGAVNATFARGGEVSVGLTYMTGALVKAGQHFAAVFTQGWNNDWLPYAALWTAIAAGSVAGAATYLAVGSAGIWFAAGALALAAGLLGASRRGRTS